MNRVPFFFIIVAFLGISCVSQKKYDALEADKFHLQKQYTKLKKALKGCEEARDQLSSLKEEHESLQSERDELKRKFDNLRGNYAKLNEQNDALANQKTTILQSTSEEKRALSEELALKESELMTREKELSELDEELQIKGEELDDLRASLEDRERRIAELQAQLDAHQSGLTELKSKLSEALLGFSDTDLTVTQKDGKVYVSLSQDLLFAKGSDNIDARGKDAIQKVARVLAQQDDIDILVEGHTDTDGTEDFNWDLSVDRATAVVKLLSRHGVNQKQLTAGGRAYFDPVAPNDIEANKSKNRRTEIILAPQLDEVMKLLES